MHRFIAWWVDNPVAANLLMLGIALAGFLGFLAMEREAFPQVKPNRVQVQVTWPGAAPQEVEEQVVARIEDALDDLDSVSRIYATATEGLAELDVRTYPGVDINAFLDEVKNAVDASGDTAAATALTFRAPVLPTSTRRRSSCTPFLYNLPTRAATSAQNCSRSSIKSTCGGMMCLRSSLSQSTGASRSSALRV